MAALQGTILASKIVPTDSLDTYATHEDKYGRGGHRSVDTLEERDNITTPRRKEGMTVYVKENKTKYILEGGVDNANWKVDSSGGGSGGDVDLSDYYKKTEAYSKIEVDTKIADIPPTDLSGYYNKTQTETLLSNKVEKEAGKGLSTNDFTNTFKQAIELKKVQGISTDSVTKKLVVNYTDSTVANLNINDIITDVHVSGATLDATTNVLTLTSTEGGADVTVDLSDFVNSGELTSALSGKADNIHSHSTSNITGLDATLSNKVTKNEAIIGATKTKITYDSNGLVTGGTDLSASDIPNLPQSKIINLETNLSSKIDKGAGVVGATKTKITYNNDGIITGGADLVEADLPNISQAKVTNLVSDLSNKQSKLVSGTNIKTINGQSVLGSGNIVIIDEGSVQLTENQTVDGVKTFSSSIVGDITGNAATTTKLKTPVKINGIDFDGSVDITIEAGGSGSSTFTGTAAIDIGGVKVGDSWDNAPISDVVNAIINPELFPTFVNPTFSFTSTVNGFREVGSVTDITFNVNFSRGSITPQYSAENSYRSGLPTTYNYSGPVGSEAKANNTLTDTKTITGYSIAIGSNTFSCSVDYSIGTQPKSSKGNDFNTPLPAGALAAKSVTITGVYPVYSGIGTLSKIPLQAHGTAIVVDAPADMNVGGNRFTIHYPNVWSGKTPIVQQENELSKAWDNQNMLEYEITDINISGVPYKQVKYVGSGIGARKLRLVF